MERQRQESPELVTQNGRLRHRAKGLVDAVALKIHQMTGMSAHDATRLGLILEILADGYAAYENTREKPSFKRRLPVVAAKGVALAFDFIDGSIARQTGTKSEKGALLDAKYDRLKEAVAVGEHGLVASTLRNRFLRELGMGLTVLSGEGNLVPSLTRSLAEERGRVVSEDGDNKIEFFGTSPGRAITNTLSTSYYELQMPLDAFNFLIGNYVGAKRLRTAMRNGEEMQLLPKEERQLAGKKLRMFTETGAFVLAGIGAEVAFLNHTKKS